MSERARSSRQGRVAAESKDDDAEAGSYAETVEEQADFEGLVREHDDDWQAGVQAEARGDEPPEDKKSVSGA